MTLSAGTRLGPYEILAPLGAGGMGEVYKARDTRLDRSVAVKILSTEFANDAALKLRFEREAKTISQLEDPHICRLYDIGGEGGTQPDAMNYIVMELLDGESLADRLARGALPLAEVLTYGAQIAGALARAHRAGIVHRDLKPGNVMITRSGAKLLDFGLAKAPSSRSVSRSRDSFSQDATGATALRPLTAEGSIVGTFQYMAPEQLAGEEADERSDLFALGAVLYELATGHRAFEGKTKTSLIAQIVGGEPRPIRELQPMTPPLFEHVVQKCLAKEPEDRWQSAQDVASQLLWILQTRSDSSSPAGAAVTGIRRRRSIVWPALLGLVIAVAAVLGVLLFRTRREAEQLRQPLRFALQPAFLGTEGDADFHPRISSDGRMILFSPDYYGRNTPLYVQSLDVVEPHPVQGTMGAWGAFWSQDSRSIGYFAAGKLQRIPVGGGAPQQLADVGYGRGGAWGRDAIVFASTSSSNLRRISPGGGSVTDALTLDPGEAFQRWPVFLPDQRHFLYLSARADERGILPGTSRPSSGRDLHRAIYVAALDSKEHKKIVDADSAPVIAAGWLFYLRGTTLYRQRFDEEKLALTGEADIVTTNVDTELDTSSSWFSASDELLAYRAGGAPASYVISWLDRSGKPVGNAPQTAALTGSYDHLQLSPDGTSVLVDQFDNRSGVRNVWTIDLARGVKSRVTFGQSADWIPVWSPDGKKIVWISDRDGQMNAYIKSLDGDETAKKLMASKEQQHHLDWSRDGRYLVEERVAAGNQEDVWLYDFQTGESKALLNSSFHEMYPRISPDGHWMAYTSSESGTDEIYVQRFPGGGGKVQVSLNGGAGERWRADSRELYFVSPRGEMMAAAISFKDGRLEADEPRVLFTAPFYNNHSWDVSADGTKFIAPVMTRTGPRVPITMVLHWQSAGAAK